MAREGRITSEFNRDDVSFFWSGGRNITWRLTHVPTGIFVEGSTHLADANFTKKKVRIADDRLRGQLLGELAKKVLKHNRSAAIGAERLRRSSSPRVLS